jgi:DNA replication protein DnaC
MNECLTCGNKRFVVSTRGGLAWATRCPNCSAVCPICQGVGYQFSEGKDGYEVATTCNCTGLDARIDAFNRAQIPGNYAHAGLEPTSFKSGTNRSLSTARHDAWKLAKEYAAGSRGVLYHGPCGSGKTHLMIGILRHLALHRGVRVRYIEFIHLLASLKARFNDPSRYGDPLADLVAVPVLAVDELGKNRGTDWETGVLDELISKRYNANRTTLFTTNLTPVGDARDSLRERVGERIYSRLIEMCQFEHLQSEDYRKIRAAHYDD